MFSLLCRDSVELNLCLCWSPVSPVYSLSAVPAGFFPHGLHALISILSASLLKICSKKPFASLPDVEGGNVIYSCIQFLQDTYITDSIFILSKVFNDKIIGTKDMNVADELHGERFFPQINQHCAHVLLGSDPSPSMLAVCPHLLYDLYDIRASPHGHCDAEP